MGDSHGQDAGEATGKRSRSGVRRLAFGILAVALAALPLACKLGLSIDELCNGFLSDDAFYYYKTALNIREGLGSTYVWRVERLPDASGPHTIAAPRTPLGSPNRFRHHP